MNEYLQAFVLGNAAILTNVCMLPLYPSMIAFLAGNAERDHQLGNARYALGALVLAGLLTMMIAIALVMWLLNQAIGTIFPIVLPIAYVAVIVMGVALLLGRNPFVGAGVQAPLVRNPFGSAYVYGMLLAPMTLPCTGPIIVSAFTLASVSGEAGALFGQIAYFLAFGLGFGWPLVLLPFINGQAQKAFTRTMIRYNEWLKRGSGVLLILVGLYGLWDHFLRPLAAG
jgi:cytochrome c-type biogenesis protein